jgi:hypothetical protein
VNYLGERDLRILLANPEVGETLDECIAGFRRIMRDFAYSPGIHRSGHRHYGTRDWSRRYLTKPAITANGYQNG